MNAETRRGFGHVDSVDGEQVGSGVLPPLGQQGAVEDRHRLGLELITPDDLHDAAGNRRCVRSQLVGQAQNHARAAGREFGSKRPFLGGAVGPMKFGGALAVGGEHVGQLKQALLSMDVGPMGICGVVHTTVVVCWRLEGPPHADRIVGGDAHKAEFVGFPVGHADRAGGGWCSLVDLIADRNQSADAVFHVLLNALHICEEISARILALMKLLFGAEFLVCLSPGEPGRGAARNLLLA